MEAIYITGKQGCLRLMQADTAKEWMPALPEDMTASERQKAERVFYNYEDVFAKSGRPMGRSTLV